MPRISTYAANNSALMDLMNAQRQLFDAQKQLTTGKKATDLKGVGHEAETISATRAAITRAESFREAGIRAAARLEAQDTALNQLSDSAVDLRMAVTTKDGDFIMHQLGDAFYQAANALNTRHAGAYLFGGTRSDVKPLNVDTLADLVPLASAADAFDNNDRRPQVQMDTNISVDVGVLGTEAGEELMASFKRIADYDAGVNGPFANPLTDVQETFLIGEIQNIIAATDNLTTLIGETGSTQANVEKLTNGHEDRTDFLTRMLSDLEDVDMAEAATRFQAAQTAVDVSARTFATLSDVSLLPFLR